MRSAADDLVRALLTAVADPVWIVDRNLALHGSNAAFATLCERAFASPPALADPFWTDLARRALNGRAVSADARYTIDGVERSFTISGTPYSDGAVFLAHDVTDTTRAEREDLLELAVTSIFATDKPIETLLEETLEFICESDDWDCAVVWLVSDENLAPAALWSRPGIDAAQFRERTMQLQFGRGHGVPGWAWSRDEVVWVDDLLDETGLVRAESAARAGLHGAAAVPIRDADRVIGVMEILTRTVRPMSEQRRRALSRAGTSLGRLIVRKQLRQAIERKGQEWSLTFDGIELPILITELDGTIVRVNRAARDLAGSASFHDVLHRPIALAKGEPWQTLADTVAAVRDSRTPCTAQISAGEKQWDVNASWFRSATDDAERVIVVMRDTTTLMRLQESVRRGEQLAALGELVAGVAHEVRNPIFGMGLTVDALGELIPKDPDVVELFGILRAWLDRLNRLMENLLQYGKTWTLELKEDALESLLTHVVEVNRAIATNASVSIDLRTEPGLTMLMDGDRLIHVFENLITNALQHSRPGQSIEITARGGDDGNIECMVRDHGPGFPVVDLPRIFEPFFTKRRGGTGLGLAIVQRIVDEHGGTITASNGAQGGAVVTIRFPAYRSTSL